MEPEGNTGDYDNQQVPAGDYMAKIKYYITEGEVEYIGKAFTIA